ncbi:hypothetical protein [Corynebacterium cystitidis]|nr:hypothetical protein [Corynebacterium cystitidis]
MHHRSQQCWLVAVDFQGVFYQYPDLGLVVLEHHSLEGSVPGVFVAGNPG